MLVGCSQEASVGLPHLFKSVTLLVAQWLTLLSSLAVPLFLQSLSDLQWHVLAPADGVPLPTWAFCGFCHRLAMADFILLDVIFEFIVKPVEVADVQGRQVDRVVLDCALVLT